jgi:paraquat-inducible protein B
MSRQASPAVIGSFVVGALVLVVLGILVFGSGRFFADTDRVVMYFADDLQGLQAGAAVDFQGVPVGTVAQIKAVIDPQNVEVHIPVIVELQPASVEFVKPRPQGDNAIQRLVERGVQAQLQLESLVTGQVFIQLDFHPEAPAATFRIDPLTKLPEMPTVPSTRRQVAQTVRKVLEKFGELPLDDIVTTLDSTLQGLDRLLNAPEVRETLSRLNTTLTDVQRLARDLDKQVTPVAAGVTTALGSVEGAMGDLGKLARNADGRVTALTADLQDTLKTARVALETAQEALKNVNGMTAPNSPVGYELVDTLRELSEAARAVRVLADFLERNPSAVLFGRTATKAQ